MVQIDDLLSAPVAHNHKDRALVRLHSVPDQRWYPRVQRLLRHPRDAEQTLRSVPEEKFGDRQAAFKVLIWTGMRVRGICSAVTSRPEGSDGFPR